MDLNSPVWLVVTTTLLSLLMTILSTGTKVLMHSEKIGRTRSERSEELFKVFFVGQDLALISFGLTITGPFIRKLMENVPNKSTTFGDNFFYMFAIMIVVIFTVIFFCMIIWKYNDGTRYFKTETEEIEIRVNGVSEKATFYRVDFIKSLLWTSQGRGLILANLLGTATIIGYIIFIVSGGLIK